MYTYIRVYMYMRCCQTASFTFYHKNGCGYVGVCLWCGRGRGELSSGLVPNGRWRQRPKAARSGAQIFKNRFGGFAQARR